MTNIIITLIVILLSTNFALADKRYKKKNNSFQYSKYYEKDESIKIFYHNSNPSAVSELNIISDPGCDDVYEEYSGKINLALRPNLNYYKFGNNFSSSHYFDLSCNVKVFLVTSSNTVKIIDNLTMFINGSISDFRPEHIIEIELDDLKEYNNEKINKIKIELSNFILNASSDILSNSNQNEFHLEASYKLNKKYGVLNPSLSDIPLVSVNYEDASSNSNGKFYTNDKVYYLDNYGYLYRNNFRLLRLAWNTTCDYSFDSYQIQLLKLENTLGDPNSFYNDDFIKTKIDWENSTTIEVGGKKKYLDLYLTQGRGVYVWRVRPIYTLFDGGIANAQNWGDWNSKNINSLEQGFLFDTKLMSNPNDAFHYIFNDDNGVENLNWTHTRMYNEGESQGTQIFDKISYSDELLNIRQIQKVIHSDDNVIISETVPDYTGRTVLSSIPSSVGAETGWESYYTSLTRPKHGVDLNFKDGNLKTSNGKKFSQKDFDISAPKYTQPGEDKIIDIEPVTSGLTIDYYDNSTQIGVPSSENYPFNRTIYYNDGTGRIKEQRFPGAASNDPLISGNSNYARIKNFYSIPLKEELLAFFGKEAPDVSKVIKQYRIDPNGVMHVTYKDVTGKVLASGIIDRLDSEEIGENLNTQDEKNKFNIGPDDIEIDILDNPVPDRNSQYNFYDEKDIFLDRPSSSNLKYFLNPNELIIEDVCIAISDENQHNIINDDYHPVIGINSEVIIKNIDEYYSRAKKYLFQTNTFDLINSSNNTILEFDITDASPIMKTSKSLPLLFNPPSLTDDYNYSFSDPELTPPNNIFQEPAAFKIARKLKFSEDDISQEISNYKENINEELESILSNEFEYLRNIVDEVEGYTIGDFKSLLTGTWGWSSPNPNNLISKQKTHFYKEIFNCNNQDFFVYLHPDVCKEEICSITEYGSYSQYLFDFYKDFVYFDDNTFEKPMQLGEEIENYLFRKEVSLLEDFTKGEDYNNDAIDILIRNMLNEKYRTSHYVTTNDIDISLRKNVGDPIWSEEEICECWVQSVEKFKINNFDKNTDESVNRYVINKKFDLLDDFLTCTGKMLEGYSNTPYVDPNLNPFNADNYDVIDGSLPPQEQVSPFTYEPKIDINSGDYKWGANIYYDFYPYDAENDNLSLDEIQQSYIDNFKYGGGWLTMAYKYLKPPTNANICGNDNDGYNTNTDYILKSDDQNDSEIIFDFNSNVILKDRDNNTKGKLVKIDIGENALRGINEVNFPIEQIVLKDDPKNLDDLNNYLFYDEQTKTNSPDIIEVMDKMSQYTAWDTDFFPDNKYHKFWEILYCMQVKDGDCSNCQLNYYVDITDNSNNTINDGVLPKVDEPKNDSGDYKDEIKEGSDDVIKERMPDDDIDYQNPLNYLNYMSDLCETECENKNFKDVLIMEILKHPNNYIIEGVKIFKVNNIEYEMNWDQYQPEDYDDYFNDLSEFYPIDEQGINLTTSLADLGINKVFSKAEIKEYVLALVENCKNECTINIEYKTNSRSTSDDIIVKKGNNNINYDKSLENILTVLTHDFEIKLPWIDCDGVQQACDNEENNYDLLGYESKPWKRIGANTYIYTENGEEKEYNIPTIQQYHDVLLNNLNESLVYIKEKELAGKSAIKEFYKAMLKSNPLVTEYYPYHIDNGNYDKSFLKYYQYDPIISEGLLESAFRINPYFYPTISFEPVFRQFEYYGQLSPFLIPDISKKNNLGTKHHYDKIVELNNGQMKRVEGYSRKGYSILNNSFNFNINPIAS